MDVVLVVVANAAVRRPSSLEEVHQSEVDSLTGQSVDNPRTRRRPDSLVPSAAVDLDRRPTAADESSPRADRSRVARHAAPITATLRRSRRRPVSH